jgi:hypothetical protein
MAFIPALQQQIIRTKHFVRKSGKIDLLDYNVSNQGQEDTNPAACGESIAFRFFA